MGQRSEYCGGLEFTFGPNESFFINSPKYWSWSNNVPQELRSIFSKSSEVYNCLLFPDQGWFVEYRQKSDGKTYQKTTPDKKKSNFAYGYDVMQGDSAGSTIVSGNPTVGYIGVSAGKGHSFSCGSAPTTAWECVKNKKHANWDRKYACHFATLGIHGSYYVGFERGGSVPAISRYYPTLDAILGREKSSKGGGGKVLYLSLNPYAADQYVLVFDNGDIHFKVADALQYDVATALGKVDELNGGFARKSQIPAPYNPVSVSDSKAVTQRKGSGWWKKVGDSIIGAAMSTVMSAALGACNVM